MGQALPKPALRPFLSEDTPVLAAIFAASVEELTGDDYSEAQQEAWASDCRAVDTCSCSRRRHRLVCGAVDCSTGGF